LSIYKSIRPDLNYTKLKMLHDKVDLKKMLYAPKLDGVRAVLSIGYTEGGAQLVTEDDNVYMLQVVVSCPMVVEVEIVETRDGIGLAVYDILKVGKQDMTVKSFFSRMKALQVIGIAASFPIYYQKYTSIGLMYSNKRYYESEGIKVDGIVCVHSYKSYMADMYKWKMEETLECMVRVRGDQAYAVLNAGDSEIELQCLENREEYLDGEVYEFRIKKRLTKVRLRPDRKLSNSVEVYDNILLFNKRAKYLSEIFKLHSELYYGLRREDSSFEVYAQRS